MKRKKKRKYKIGPEARANIQAAARKRVARMRAEARNTEQQSPIPKKEDLVVDLKDKQREAAERGFLAVKDREVVLEQQRLDPPHQTVRLCKLTRRLQSLLATYGDVPVFIMGYGHPRQVEYRPEFTEVQIVS